MFNVTCEKVADPDPVEHTWIEVTDTRSRFKFRGILKPQINRGEKFSVRVRTRNVSFSLFLESSFSKSFFFVYLRRLVLCTIKPNEVPE